MPEALSDEWISRHFDVYDPDLARNLHPTLARARSTCPVARTDVGGGYWVATRYEDVLAVAQNWATFSNELGITPPQEGEQQRGKANQGMKILPVGIDPPLHREFKRLINRHFTPAVVEPWEAPTRALVTQLIDGFIERGSCDFMADFARPLPGLAFFDLALHAPRDDLDEVNSWATKASLPDHDEARDGLMRLAGWIGQLIEQRQAEGPRGDVVDTVLAAEIDGRPITVPEAIGTIHLLVLGGLETTAGVLGMAMLRFCEQPELPALLRRRPELIPDAVEELLRLDGSFICVGRTTRHEATVGDQAIGDHETVMLYWAAANRDPDEFDRPDEFDLARPQNRHLAFGAGPHRCAGSNLARMNLRIALHELVQRLEDVSLEPGAEIEWHSALNRAPQAVPIRFRPGPRQGA